MKNKVFFYLLSHKYLILILGFFCIVFCSISLVNHYNFRTNAGDLGIYNQAVYDYAHFRFNYNTIWYGNRENNILSDHLSTYQLLISPFYWVFKSYTLLIFQIVSILFGGLGIYKYIKLISKNKRLALIALVHFFSIWGIYSALGFDYHDNVVASMFLPWFFYYLTREKYLYTFLFFTLFILGRENMIIWGVFISGTLFFVNIKYPEKRKFLLGLFLFSVVALFLVFKVIMPSFQSIVEYSHFKFTILGENYKDAIINVTKHPIKVIEALFTNHINNPSAKYVKEEFLITLLLSGGFALLFKPKYLIILIPIFSQKLLHDTYTHWSLSYHYSIEFAPILTIALFEWLSERRYKGILIYASILTVICFIINIIKIENKRPSWLKNSNVELRFYSKEHYRTPYDIEKVKRALEMIPKNAKVSAQPKLIPHIADRKVIYQYPRVRDANYIVLFPSSYIYMQTVNEYISSVKSLLVSNEWETLIKDKDILLFKRRIHNEVEIKKVMNQIKMNSEWYEFIKKQAKERNQTIEETLRNNAIHVIKTREN